MTAEQVQDADASGSTQLEAVSEYWANDPQLPWMLASAAIIQGYKVISNRVGEVLGTIDGLTMTRYEVLGLLERAELHSMTVREIKSASFLHPPTLTYIVDWLEARGLVTRRTDKVDRRSVVVTLTPKGRRLFRKASDALAQINFGLLGLDADGAEAVLTVLSAVVLQDSASEVIAP